MGERGKDRHAAPDPSRNASIIAPTRSCSFVRPPLSSLSPSPSSPDKLQRSRGRIRRKEGRAGAENDDGGDILIYSGTRARQCAVIEYYNKRADRQDKT
mmetsp:Transcript_8379/g.18313  ORF Transcript_8379/g.18313 Transcript_8379/m.18313 type:complete len:99 (-) Transcript_8379:94-390(-)